MAVANPPLAAAPELDPVAERDVQVGSSPERCPGCGHPLTGPSTLRGPDRFMGGPGEFGVVECGACGLVSTLPRLRPEQFDDYYPTVYYHADPDDPGPGTEMDGAPADELSFTQRARLEAIVRHGPYRTLFKRPPGRLLDVGCGNGDLAVTFARHGWDACGVEPAAPAAARAARRGVDVHCGLLPDAPWSGPTFDAIVFNHSLEHVPDPAATVREAAALLAPGGMLAVAVPNFGCWQRRLFGARWFQLDLPRHLQHFDRATLPALIARSGLRPVAVVTASMRPSILLSLQYLAFGRARWTGRGLRLAAWAAALPLWLADRVSDGDCLHVFAVRD